MSPDDDEPSQTEPAAGSTDLPRIGVARGKFAVQDDTYWRLAPVSTQTAHIDADGSVTVVIPPEIAARVGIRAGDTLDFELEDRDSGRRLVITPVCSPGERTVVADRYAGAYSGARYVAWPLAAAAVPPDSQGGDIAAAAFWAEPHLCGRGDTPDAALADLERILELR